jgi:nitrogen regulatory protein P-II 1
MKLLIAIIKPFRLSDVKDALAEIGVSRMTVSEVKGFGRQKGHSELYRGSEYQVDFIPKVRIELALEDHQVPAVCDAITDAARSDTIGDGKIFVLPLEYARRIRTGEEGDEAL